ncbi:MAG: hypothetical protein A3I63_06630 [Betaproteobacteria bacterium RIFCSPLOWO2_02_FULL_66_14]|nr:MAG: hypothetical protein A3I63_06630 [Betaproteobacteria bacterium RIFCSPLOWO2_02_FULL_66_14]
MHGLVLLRNLCGVLLCAAVLAARADEIVVREAQLSTTDEGLVLDADFDFALKPRLAEAVAGGVPLYFVVEFELARQRWWWFDEKAAAKRNQLRLSYHPLSRQYRLSTGMLNQHFSTLEEALQVLRRVRNWLVAERGATSAETQYDAAVRMRLDVSMLPKPFQVSAITSRDLHQESPWMRFPFRTPAATPAPVESREPKEAGSR